MVEKIAVLNLQVKIGDGTSHRLAQMVTTLNLMGKTNANTIAALFLISQQVAKEIDLFAQTEDKIAALNLQVKIGDGTSHRRAKMAGTL
jgi:hypothetical protein